MKKYKIFALPSHQEKERTHGVDFARIIQPMKHLNGYKDSESEFETTMFDIGEKEGKTDWLYVAQNYDAIYLNYINNPWGYAAMGAMARKHGVKMILDLDDALWKIKPDNPAYSVYEKGTEAIKNFTAICNDVDYMTTTNSYLKNIIINNTSCRPEKIKVFPNYIDLDLYKHRSKFKDDSEIMLTHYGSTTHFADLAEYEFVEGINKVMSTYPQVKLRTIGAFIPKFKLRWGQRYDNPFGHQDIYGWINEKFPQFMDETDIVVVPLAEDIYTRAKSSIKFIETSSAKIPGVYQKIRQYTEAIEEGKTGLLASKADEWYEKIKYLIDNPDKRKEIGENAYKEIVKNHQMKNHVADYAIWLKSILTK